VVVVRRSRITVDRSGTDASGYRCQPRSTEYSSSILVLEGFSEAFFGTWPIQIILLFGRWLCTGTLANLNNFDLLTSRVQGVKLALDHMCYKT
jgi:hypothetical protein